MPAQDVTVTATYENDTPDLPDTYKVTVENGALVDGPSDSKYAKDATVSIKANEPESGKKFKEWTGEGVDFADASSEETTFHMPAQDVTVTATYENDTPVPDKEYDITYADAENGTVSGIDKAVAGAEVTVTVEPAEGYALDTLKVNGKDVTGGKFTMPAEDVTVTATFRLKPTGGCYIATSVYGSYDTPEVWTLRRFRDETLADTWYGRLFIKAYYAVSPTLVRLFGDDGWFQEFWRDRLDTMVEELQEAGYESAPYQDIDW